MTARPDPEARPLAHRSKAIATWLALLLGPLGIHRMYLHGLRDFWAWAQALLAGLGMIGVQRMRLLGQDDQLATLLVPVLGAMISLALFTAIVWGLTPDEKWDARHNPGGPRTASGWPVVIAVVLSLLVGGTVLMGTIAFTIQHLFEWQLQR